MPNKIKIKLPDGREVDATPIEINQASEQWSHYLLDDGSTLKVKLVVTKVSRIDNVYDVEGNPVYFFQSTNVTSVNSPENLKRKI
ncbi:MAG: hypothetical protein FJZ16_01495 [Candidatus Omnitrophica bacterium]|nr:hypothetical protein [Candidatus Omnitrophota bacterium]